MDFTGGGAAGCAGHGAKEMSLELLQFLANVAVLPALAYVIVLERRLMKIEVMLAVKLDSLPCLKKSGGNCNVENGVLT